MTQDSYQTINGRNVWFNPRRCCEFKKDRKDLNEKATVLKNFDNDILELIEEAGVLTEIQDSSNLSNEINETH